MKEGVAAPVGIEPVLQILPGFDFVHRLVLHQALEHVGRAVPGDALQLQQRHVEPRGEQTLQFQVERSEQRVVAQEIEQLGAQVDEEMHAGVGSRELGEDAAAGAAQALAQRRFRLPLLVAAARRAVGVVGGVDALGLGAELGEQDAQESPPAVFVELGIGLGELGGALARAHLAADEVGAFAQLVADALEHFLGRRLEPAAHQRQSFAQQIVAHGFVLASTEEGMRRVWR